MDRSRWLHLPTLLLAVSFARPAFAGTSPPGVNLRWDACYADGGARNKNFACNTNDGQDQLVASFEVDQIVGPVVTEEITIDLRAASAALPAWWQVFNAGSCRPLALDFVPFPSSDPSACEQWLAYPVGGGIAAYTVGEQGPEHVRVGAAIAMTTAHAATLTPGHEYFGFRLTLDHTKTLGAGACAGCTTPVCIFLSRITLYAPNNPTPLISLDHGANYLGSQYVTWQNGYPIDVQRECDPGAPACAFHYTSFDCVLATPTATQRTTWGAVKALYR